MSIFFTRLHAKWALRGRLWRFSYWAVVVLLGLLALLRQLAVIAVVVLHWAHTALAEAAGPLVAAVNGDLPDDLHEPAGDSDGEAEAAPVMALATRLDESMTMAGTK